MKRLACHKRPAANVASSRRSGSEVEKVPERVADTAPDWLVEPDPTAQLYVFLVTAAKLVNGLLYENMYMFLYRWYPGAGFSCSKGSITVSSNLTVYRLKPVNKPQYLTRDVLAITPPRPPNFNVGHDANTRRCFCLLRSQH